MRVAPGVLRGRCGDLLTYTGPPAMAPPKPDLAAQVAALERRIAELEQEVAGYRRLTDNVPGMVYQFVLRPDASMGFTFASEGAREVYGCEPEAILRDYRVVFAQVAAADVASFMRAVRASATSLSAYKWEGQLARDGQIRWIQAASRPNLQGDGSIVWDGVILDITHRKEADAALALGFRQQETIRLQEELLAQLSAPLIPLSREVIVLPLIGAIDRARAAVILESLLEGVARSQVRTIILDLTGVAAVDAVAVAMIASAAKGVKLLGARMMLTGIGPEVAKVLVAMGAELGGARLLGTLQAAVAAALRGR